MESIFSCINFFVSLFNMTICVIIVFTLKKNSSVLLIRGIGKQPGKSI